MQCKFFTYFIATEHHSFIHMLIYLNWSIVALQCFASFCYIAKWISYLFIHISSVLHFLPIYVTTEHWIEFPVLYGRFVLAFFQTLHLFNCLFLAALGLRCCGQAYSGCAECGLFIAAASLVAEHWLQDKHRLKHLQHAGLAVWCSGLADQQHEGSFQTRDSTCVPCISRQILYWWTIRIVYH